MKHNLHDYSCKGRDFAFFEEKRKVISEETTLYFDVGQKSFRALGQRQRVPYQLRFLRTS